MIPNQTFQLVNSSHTRYSARECTLVLALFRLNVSSTCSTTGAIKDKFAFIFVVMFPPLYFLQRVLDFLELGAKFPCCFTVVVRLMNILIV